MAALNIGREVESTVGGTTTCIVCFVGAKTHIAVPCGHLCLCESCAESMEDCPGCRQPVKMWMKFHEM